MQNPELFACLSKERKENLLGTLLFRPSIYERLYYEEEMVRKQIVCYEEFLQIVRNPQIRAAAPEIDFEFEEFSANSYLSLVDEYLYWNKVPGDILLRLKKAAEDALAYARENKNFRQNEETLLGTLHTIQGYLCEISISEMLDTYVNWPEPPVAGCILQELRVIGRPEEHTVPGVFLRPFSVCCTVYVVRFA